MIKRKTDSALKPKSKVKASAPEVMLWWIVRIFLVFCLFNAKTAEKAVFTGLCLALTFAVTAGKLLSKKEGFISRLPMGLQTCICLSAFFGAGVGLGLGLLDTNEYYDIFLQLFAGVIGAVMGYFISIGMKKTETKGDVTFASLFALAFSGMLSMVRKTFTFLIDYYTGRNLMNHEYVGDDHWFIELLGPMMSPYDQRPLYDMNEDFILSFLGSAVTSGVIYLALRIKHKAAFAAKKVTAKEFFSRIPQKMKSKALSEIEKVRRDTNIVDLLFWWCTRAVMLYAFIDMYFVRGTTAEALLLGANFVGTFGITIAHFVFPRDSVICKISYKVQSLLTVIIFLGSYCGNYVFVYNWVGRFDLFLHFISGYLVVMVGYYLAKTLFTRENKTNNIRLVSFATAFSFAVIPFWEATEFMGDYIWGTQNQGWGWGPTEDSFFFKVFGNGIGNTGLYRFFDTMYDSLLAAVTTVITGAALLLFLEYKRTKGFRKSRSENKMPLIHRLIQWVTGAFLLFCLLTAKTAETRFFLFLSLVMTFAISGLKLFSDKEEGFIARLPGATQTVIALSAFFGAGVGLGLGLLDTNEYYDIFLQLFAGAIGVVMGYFISVGMKKIETKGDVTFAVIFAMSFSGMLSIVRKLTTFFIDYYTGRNLMKYSFPDEEHWFCRLLGTMGSMQEQRPLLDMNEDFLLSFIGYGVASLVLYAVLRVKNKKLFTKERPSLIDALRNIPSRMASKLFLEISKVREQTNIFDMIFWWGLRFLMIKAFFVIYFERGNTAEAWLLFANIVGTFAIFLAHFIFPRDSVVCRLSYKTQSLISIITFLGSYCTSYAGVYGYISRFDLFVHFLSGVVVTMLGYYICKALFSDNSRMGTVRTVLFSVAFSFFVIPAWEAMEFCGDYIWGTTNQNFMWIPSAESFFFKAFGHGIGNENLYCYFDTVYDSLLAIVTTIITGAVLFVCLEVKREKQGKLKQNLS